MHCYLDLSNSIFLTISNSNQLLALLSSSSCVDAIKSMIGGDATKFYFDKMRYHQSFGLSVDDLETVPMHYLS